MVAYWDGSAFAGEMCAGCRDCAEGRPLNHEERRQLIRTPITFRVIGRESWGGTCIVGGAADRQATRARYSHAHEREDET